MMKRIVISGSWALAFFAITLLGGMIFFAALGSMDPRPSPSKLVLIGRLWSLVSISLPIVGFTLAWFGRLPFASGSGKRC